MKAIACALIVIAFALAAPLACAEGMGQAAQKFVVPAGPDEKFMSLSVGNVKVLYTEGWTEAARKIADKTNTLLTEGLAKIGIQQPKSSIEITLRAVIPDDLALCVPQEQKDLQKLSVRFPIAVPEGNADSFTLDDMRIKGSIQAVLNYGFLFDVIGANADSIQSNPRWFLFGLATYLGAGAAKELAPDNAENLVQTQFGDKALENYKEQLLKWVDKNPGPNDQVYVLGCTQMFTEIEKKSGADAIKKIGAAYAASPKADTDSIVKLISDSIGTDFIAFLKAYTAPKRVFLGVIADKTFAGPGAKVLGVNPYGCVAQAGIAKGDIITKVNGEDLKDAATLGALVAKSKIGDVMQLTVNRAGSEAKITVTLAEPNLPFPPAPGTPMVQQQPQQQQAPAPPTPEEILQLFRSTLAQSLTEKQADLLFQYLQHTPPGAPPKIDPDTAKKVIDYLKMKGFSPMQAQLLLIIFELSPDAVKHMAEDTNKVQKANENKNLTPEEMMANMGWDPGIAKLQCMMLRKGGMTDDQIKDGLRSGKIQKPNMGAPPGMPPGGMPNMPPMPPQQPPQQGQP